MERTPAGTSVGVEDPYEHAGRCDHLTDDGRCRRALEGDAPAGFVADLRGREYTCPAADPDDDWDWSDCPHYRYRQRNRACLRCGLAAKPMPGDERPLLEEHHLSYPGGPTDHEITVYLCRWCHAKVHDSWAAVTDDVGPDPEAIAEREARRSRELDEAAFETAAERYGYDDGESDRAGRRDGPGDGENGDAGD